MATPTFPPTTTQPSRKGKKAWRKNVDIAPIESGLEDLRQAQITHGGVLAEKNAEELFVADTVGDEEIARKAGKVLKAQEILGQRSKVPGLEGRKRKRKSDDSGGGDGAAMSTVDTMGKKARTGTYVPHRTLQHLRNVADGATPSTMQTETASHDPWAPVAPRQTPDFLPPAQAQPPKKREPRTLKKPPHPLTSTTTPIPHVPLPDPGKSYNPLVDSYAALLAREGEQAVEAEKARLESAALEAEKEARAAAEAARVEAAEEAAWATDYEDSEWEGFQSEAEGGATVWTAKAKGRLTPAERKKVKARKEREAREVHERKMREREREEARIAKIAREVAERSQAGRRRKAGAVESASTTAAAVGEEEDQDVDDGETRVVRPRLGKLAVPEAPLEVVLPEELEDSLRRLKPEGDLMLDRYRNLLVNGKVEVRKRRGEKKQRKTTRSEKWSYKDWKLR